MESDGRQSTARCSTFCRATAVHPSHHDCSSLDALSAPKTRARRLPDNLRRYQDRLGTCRTFPDSLRDFRMSPRPAGHLQETPRKSATAPRRWEDTQTVCDGARES
ncbi:hypothetical protein DPMN_014012 [Dreissena polymorpha]|uniref:Uncharacterized protein n=1 Tax=Dreissena polymorpha TaxID=45954 RepID=A0A9D4N8Y4_DREPO|nr:hypothetical protein DPMN_014012 [Dreissena polymorpha]